MTEPTKPSVTIVLRVEEPPSFVIDADNPADFARLLWWTMRPSFGHKLRSLVELLAPARED